MKKLVLISLCLFLAGPALAQKRAFTIADLYKIKDVSDPQFSPDGRHIAFVLTTHNLQKGKSNAEIYVIDADGTNLKQMTNNPATDNHPRWSPDGKSILFVSTRSNGSQAWLIAVEGGEARQLTNISTGVGDPLWLPEGQHLIFASDVYPECGANDDCNSKIDKAASAGPLQAYLADKLLYRHWTSWKEGRRSHIFSFNIGNAALIDLTPGDYDAPAFSLGETGFAVSPEGKELCFVSNRDEYQAESTNKDLWLVPTAGGTAVNLTAENEAYDGSPAYSPDGRYLAYRFQTTPGYEADRFRIGLYDRATKQKTVLTEAFDNWVNEIIWAPDSKSIYFTADVQGHVPLYKVEVSSKRIDLVIDAKTIDGFSIAPDGKAVTLVRRSVGEPREVWRVAAGKLSHLTMFNQTLADSVDLRPAEERWIASPTGRKIHTFIVKPHNFDPAKKYPLILNVHGGPQQQWADAFRGDWQVYPGAGYIVAFPNPHGSTGYGQAFTAAISKDWGGKVYEDVMAVTDSLAKISWVDANRMGAMGWSYGGYMMMWLAGHTDRFQALAAMMGVYNLTAMHGATEELWFPEWDLGGAPWESALYQKWSPNQFVKNFKTPCLVITGERDYRVPYTQSLEFFTDLQRRRVPSRLIVFKNDGHWPSHVKSMPFYYNAHLDWFHQYLGGPPAPYDMKKMIRNQAWE
ncbi:MAG: Dipeptidyl-peptidase 5 [bacterium]|nr:Dipeptidyl-peptidase 5 [bacterium]